MSFFGKLGFTRREKTVVCILGLALLAGAVISNYRDNYVSSNLEVLTSEDSLKLQKLEEYNSELLDNSENTLQVDEAESSFNGKDSDHHTAKNENARSGYSQEKYKHENPLPVNINTASIDELINLPGIGSVLAENIVCYRSLNGAFSSIDSLLNVPGIGIKRLELIRDKITLSKP